jgi:DNA repair protein RadC
MLAKELIVSYRATRHTIAGQVRALTQPAIAAEYARALQPTPGVPWPDEPAEVFAVLCLTVKHVPIAYHVISRGSIDATIVHPAAVYRAAILSNAAAIILLHNHPSGDPSPSPDDLRLTKRLADAGALFGITVLDHLIIGEGDRYVSLREAGIMPQPTTYQE